MRRVLLLAALAVVAGSGARAQDAMEFGGWAVNSVRLRDPGQTDWTRQPRSGLPQTATVIEVRGTVIVLDLGGRRQEAYLSDVRLRRVQDGNCPAPSGPPMGSAGSQGLGPRATPRGC